jgi:hypothetical protein
MLRGGFRCETGDNPFALGCNFVHMDILPTHVHLLDTDEPQGDEGGVDVHVIASTDFLVMGSNDASESLEHPRVFPHLRLGACPAVSQAFEDADLGFAKCRDDICLPRGGSGGSGVSAVHRLLLV